MDQELNAKLEGLAAGIEGVNKRLDEGLNEVNKRLNEVNKRLDEVNGRLISIEECVSHLDRDADQGGSSRRQTMANWRGGPSTQPDKLAAKSS